MRASSRSAPRTRASAPRDVVDVVAAELLAVGGREHQRHHRLAHHAGRRDRARVGALAQRLRRLLRLGVHRAQRLRQRRAAASSRRSPRAGRRSSCRPRARRRGSSRGSSRAPPTRRSRRGPPSPRAPASAKPSPMPTPFIAWIDMIACARRPSSRSLPGDVRADARARARTRSPRTRRRATRSPSGRRRSPRPSPRSRRRRGERTGDSSTPSKSAGSDPSARV